MTVVPEYQPAAWEAGPAAVIYDALADATLARCPLELPGAVVLDAGAGTGAASKAARRRGALVVASDVSPAMLAFGQGARPPAAAADGRALPFRAGAFDVAILAFSLSHVDPPVAGLREAARVTRPGGAVVVSGFGPADKHPVKDVVQELLDGRGWTPPAWYAHLKEHVEPLVAAPRSLLELAATAGLGHATAELIDVDLGVRTPRELARWRLGMAQAAGFVEGLGAAGAAELEDEVVARLGAEPTPLVVQMALLTARILGP